jgi:hypothetical protein
MQLYFYYIGGNMIKNITGSKYITVSNNYASDPYISPGSVGAGMMRWNPNMNCIEVNDGNTWKTMAASYPTISLSPEVEQLLDWARQKQAEEQQLDELCKKYPGLERARGNFEIFKRLAITESDVPQSI